MYTAQSVANQCAANEPGHPSHFEYDGSSDDAGTIPLGRKRRQLLEFFGLTKDSPHLSVYLSTVFVQSGGSVDFRGVARNFAQDPLVCITLPVSTGEKLVGWNQIRWGFSSPSSASSTSWPRGWSPAVTTSCIVQLSASFLA